MGNTSAARRREARTRRITFREADIKPLMSDILAKIPMEEELIDTRNEIKTRMKGRSDLPDTLLASIRGVVPDFSNEFGKRILLYKGLVNPKRTRR